MFGVRCLSLLLAGTDANRCLWYVRGARDDTRPLHTHTHTHTHTRLRIRETGSGRRMHAEERYAPRRARAPPPPPRRRARRHTSEVDGGKSWRIFDSPSTNPDDALWTLTSRRPARRRRAPVSANLVPEPIRSAQSDKAHKHNSSLALAVRIILSTRRERERDVLSSTKAPWAVRVVRFISDYAHTQFHRAELTPAVPRCSNLGWCVSHTVEVTVGLRPAVVKRSWEKDGKFDSSRRDRGWAVGGARGRARGTCR